jgi:hypothetical protein
VGYLIFVVNRDLVQCCLDLAFAKESSTSANARAKEDERDE